MYSLVLGSGGLDSTGFTILMESLHKQWPKGRHVAIIPEQPCPWVGTASNITRGILPTVEHSKDIHKSHGWKDVYTAKCTPVDAMYYGIYHSADLLGFNNPFQMVFTGVNHGAVLGLDALHSSAVVAAALCSRTYGVPGVCFAQDMPKPAQGNIDRKNFKISERVLGELLHSIVPSSGECLVLNIPQQNPLRPEYAMLADYHPKFPAKMSPYLRGPRTDITALDEGCISIASLSISINSPARL